MASTRECERMQSAFKKAGGPPKHGKVRGKVASTGECERIKKEFKERVAAS